MAAKKKAKKPAKKRASKYEKKLVLKGSFEDVIKALITPKTTIQNK